MARICCCSDLHGYLPRIPDCDLLLIGGDILPLADQADARRSARWLNGPFRRWLESHVDRGIEAVGIAGNHDLIFERAPHQVPPLLPWTYLQDGEATVAGLRIWGAPHQPTFGTGWAFNLPEPDLVEKWALIPSEIDILLVHGPPHGAGDFSTYSRSHVGSPSLRDAILARNPTMVVCGHIHSGYGQYGWDRTAVVNASHCDESYQPTNPPFAVEIDVPGGPAS